jgi:hypothetical protein
MVDDVDRSLELAVEDFDGDKKPAASVNKNCRCHGSLVQMPSRMVNGKEGVVL